MPPGPAQGFVRGRGHHMGMRDRTRIEAGGDQPREMGHVHHQIGADRIGDRSELGEVYMAAIGRAAGDDQLGPFAQRDLGQGVVIDQLVLATHSIGYGLEPLARVVGGAAMGQVAAGGQVHAHEDIARLKQRQEHCLVGLGAGMRLDVGEGAAEKRLGAIDRQPLRLVDIFAPAIIAPAGIPLCVLVCHDRPLGHENGAGDDVFGSDQLDLFLLSLEFVGDRGIEIRIDDLQGRFKKSRVICCGRVDRDDLRHGRSLGQSKVF